MLLLLTDVYPVVGGVSGIAFKNFPSDVLKLASLVILVVSAGMQFHSLGPITVNELSNLVCDFTDAPLVRGGTTAQIPLRSLLQNVMFKSLGIWLFKILNMVMIVNNL